MPGGDGCPGRLGGVKTGKFSFLIRSRETFRTRDCCLVDCFQSSLFSGRAASWVRQARHLGPTCKGVLPSGSLTASARNFGAQGALLTLFLALLSGWLHAVKCFYFY